ncbi:hypothetical protein EDC01DRAFT_627365 [Geopyxis carbonaria]|nr:hypothetical protein EDC01DRAFT_627365 [Geopyxis carbonaria]
MWLEDEREEVRAKARERRQAAAERMIADSEKKLTRKGDLQPGDLVMLRDLNVAKEKGMKTSYRWTGPFVLHARTRGGSYVLKHLHDREDKVLYGHHHRDDIKLWTARPENLQVEGHTRWDLLELPATMRQYRRSWVPGLKGKV